MIKIKNVEYDGKLINCTKNARKFDLKKGVIRKILTSYLKSKHSNIGKVHMQSNLKLSIQPTKFVEKGRYTKRWIVRQIFALFVYSIRYLHRHHEQE